ncbi:type II toxin-antitoxin system HigB family toxin [Chitinophagaceae bacterium 26-R-25]|nr:type II toxin-antitoxin system HigB family toxin [Chitinophagaceae bacterium 26-R-25]
MLQYPTSKVSLIFWHRVTEIADWKRFADIKKDFGSVDFVGNDRYVFNIKGNDFRLIVMIHFNTRTVYIRWFGTHTEYDKIEEIDIL